MKRPHQHGFTLIELIIFIVVVSAGLAGILSVMNTSVKSSADPMVRKQAIAVAESLLEEILLKDYAKPAGSTALGFAAGGARTNFDCVDDYNTYASTGIVDALGDATPGLAKYNISPAVTVADSTVLPGVNAKKVTVSVTWPDGTVSLSGYRANY
jgi:MSHA pilin protein MshD